MTQSLGYLTSCITLPENSGTVDCLVPVSQAKIYEVEPQCNMDVEEDLCKDYFEYIMETEDWAYPINVEDAFNLFQSFNYVQRDV